MNKKELTEALNFAIELSQKAGKLLLKYQKKLNSLKITVKDAQGVASKADIESENLIIEALEKKYPEHEVLAEEKAFKQFKGKKNMAAAYEHYASAEWCWVIDPLDGTNNYLNAFNYYGVCISLTHFGKPVLGLVFRPGTGELFYAIKGGGAKYVPSETGRVQSIFSGKGKLKLRDALLVTGFVSEKGVYFDKEFSFFKKIMKHCRGVRRTGSAALDLCYVASGVWDGFWETGLSPWDVAAAGIICQEAGVVVSDYKGREFDPFGKSIMAFRKPLYKQVSRLF